MSLAYKKTSFNKGFTLIEVIAVLIILGIITAVALSSGMSNQNELIAQADTAKAHLRFAQLKALQDDRSDTQPWGINFGGGSYTLYRNNASASPILLPAENSSTHIFPSGVTSTTTTVNYDSWGSPVGGATAITLTQGGQSITINVAAHTGYITP